ncbi:MAG: 4-hydroxythreonine-4-phosphate dehydrogenase PdxA, partial [Candidatus Omnitrophica bacterium]|nr:4-hydroxythreonine-4-phosphate dehydrogenase PdxA [Candidatus Omnitrophota bacterium]
MPAQPTIAITAGDPCGIGPEVLLKTLRALRRPVRARLVVIGDHAVFREAAARSRLRLPSWRILSPRQFLDEPESERPLIFLDCRHPQPFTPGRSSRAAGAASLAYLDHAIALWRRRRIQALVTAPVTKWAIGRVRPTFAGQTEYLANAMRRRDVVMMFVSDRLRVALLTRHIPLSRVPRSITPRLLETTVELVSGALQNSFQIRRPTLALCGLNPHAGEEGRCGREERALMIPALRRLRRNGVACHGPFSADGFFARPQPYDAVVCAYHDQGLIPFKMAARDRGCQLTIGLPVIRTSP